MPKVSPIQTAFNSGELSPMLYARVDFPKYKNALKTCINWVETVEGPLLRRPGTKFGGEVKDSSKATRVYKFEFSVTQAYTLEIGDLYIRIWMNHGQVLSGGAPVEIVTTYTAAEIFDLKFTQSADTLYIAHQSHAPAKLTRSSHTAWTLTTIDFQDGPYLNVNSGATTLQSSATAIGAAVITASAVTDINDGQGFLATDIGRAVRLKTAGAKWGWATIIAPYIDTTHANVTIVQAFGALTATATWRLGLWSATTLYPGAVTFYEDRLVYGGSYSMPQTINGSRTGAYENMAPTDYDTVGTVAADHAYSFTLNSRDVQLIKWLLGDEKGLMAGTVRGEWIVRPSSLNDALSPTNVSAKQSTNYGSNGVDAVRAGKAALFFSRSGRKLREFAYDYTLDGFRAANMTVLSSHITRGGIVDATFQQEPHSVLWAARADGALLSFTYDREQNEFGWSRNFLGGWSNDARTVPAVVESVSVIPAPDGSYDELWMVVRRRIDGATRRYIEYMTAFWEHGDVQEDAFYVDCGLTYDSTPTLYVTGLDHMFGETATILADGAAQPDAVVGAGGRVDLAVSASVVQVGFGYNTDWETLRVEAGAADGTANGKTQRMQNVNLQLLDTLGVMIGPDFDNLEMVEFRTAADGMSEAVPLYSGNTGPQNWPGDYGDNTAERPGPFICGRIRQPFPAILQAIMPQMHTQDR